MMDQSIKRTIDRIAALSVTFYLLAALIGWLAVGIALSRMQGTGELLKQMNQELVLDWLLGAGPADWPIVAWFLILCLLNALLFANLLFCSATQLAGRLFSRGRPNRPKAALLFLIHILVLLILLGHLANLAVGSKSAHMRFAPGASRTLENGYRLHLEAVHYAPPVKYLKMDPHEARSRLSREKFDIHENYARIRVTRNGSESAAGRVFLLSPLKKGALRVTLNRFFLAEDSAEPSVGAVLTFAVNPIHEAFFMAYAALIGSLLLYLLVQREPRGGGPAPGGR
jgi:hypothetical protein